MAALLIQKRGRILCSVTNAATFAENINDATTIEEIELRIRKLGAWWDEFWHIEDELLLLPQQESKSDEFEPKFFSTQATLTLEIKLRNQLESLNNDDLNATLTNMYTQQRACNESLHNKTMGYSNEVKPPRINNPPCDENYTQLPTLNDLFEATVHNNKSALRVLHVSHIGTTTNKCLYCKKLHPIYKCFKFLRCDVELRKRFIHDHDLCTNCLRVGHAVADCSSTYTCFKFRANHHTILHEPNNDSNQNPKDNNAANHIKSDSVKFSQPIISEVQNCITINTTHVGEKQPLLPTVMVSTVDTQGNLHSICTLLDSGSESTFIAALLTKRLGLNHKHAHVLVHGLSSVPADRTRGQISIKLTSRFNANHFFIADALILNNLTNYLPSQAIAIHEVYKGNFNEFCLADPKLHGPNPIDMILCMDNFNNIVHEGRVLLKPNLYLLDCLFGWVFAGYVHQKINSTTTHFTIQVNTEPVRQLLRGIWDVEKISTKINPNYDKYEERFSRTHQLITGCYLVELPLKENSKHVGGSLKAAIFRMNAIEDNFKRDIELRTEYTNFIREYEKLGHMIRIPTREVLSREREVYDLTHHAVYKVSATSKKLRVVFDCSSIRCLHHLTKDSQFSYKLPINRCQHVQTIMNPAGCTSRGISPRQMLNHNFWCNGPKYLQKSTLHWPNHEKLPGRITTIEARKLVLISTTAGITTDDTCPIKDVVDKFSPYMLVVRVINNFVRFAELSRKNTSSSVTNQHMQKSEPILIICAQQEMFQDEIQFQPKKPITNSSKLISLFLFVDESGLLGVGGYLGISNIGYSTKHPIIALKQHSLTEKLLRYLHANPSTLIFVSKTKCWVNGAKDIIIKQISNCCIHQNCPRLREQIMRSLPTSRVTLTRAFINVGVDHVGPVAISSKKGRGSKRLKGYICLFICMATKAIHLELVDELSPDAFIASLKRFTGRRGLPTAIYSDNATNFIGAQRRLDEFFRIISLKPHNEKVSAYLGTQNIQWHTIPPSTPHFGGLWEAGVKSIKGHLRRVLGDSAPTFEELQTLLIQVEAIANSRSLTPVNDNPDDLNILTPGHFLIGSPILEVPDRGPNGVTLKLSERWELIQNMARGFWKILYLEYITTLQKRSKWQHQQQNFKEGELIFIKDVNASSLTWARGRVIKVHPGEDGKVRVVTLKTSTEELKRPIVKLCKFQI